MYLWIKALHVISVISWMAGLLYLPRLFIYHWETQPDTPEAHRFALMEHRLYRIIMTPAMIVAIITGLWLFYVITPFPTLLMWLNVKMLCAGGLTGCHFAMGSWAKEFSAGHYPKNQRFFRIFNEVPTLLMIVIVIMVVVKPF